ncbi:hypothetical protein QBC34DRAFT_413566 [Podospora aff. communis PSN243]|uniref:Uncharacterized protein n=1 Tax=Podospora aff. communis PSN243 TaxID=3040156 RepID=A0AAV9GCK4_9PEZI|nr:hypothetical protein QBC34DRAFT_413566 [Podospora aff. communis PSN243]
MVSLRTLAVSAVAFAAPLVSALTADQIVTNIRSLTSKSQALQAPAQSITILNGPLIVIGQGPFPQIIAGFSDIIQTATVALGAMQASPTQLTTEADASSVANAFREFVRVHQVLLNILIGKAGLFNTIPIVGQPVAQVLRQLEAIVDTVAFSLIDSVDPATQKNMMTSDANSLSGTITIAINSYDGLSLSKKVKREFRA